MAFTLAYAQCRGNSHKSFAEYGCLAPQHGRGDVLLTINVLQVPMVARGICPPIISRSHFIFCTISDITMCLIARRSLISPA